jgi:hypothetical protein
MKARHGYKQAEVASNLDYLVQKNWVRAGGEIGPMVLAS